MKKLLKTYKTPFSTLLLMLLVGASTLLTSCDSEKFVNARRVSIWNYDSIPMDIYVNGEKAVSFETFIGEVNLISGDYELVAKQGEKELDRISISLDKETESNEYNKRIWVVGQKKNYVLINAGELYDGDGEIELVEKYIGVNYMDIECSTYQFHYPWRKLPSKVYSSGDPNVYQLLNFPEKYLNEPDDKKLMRFLKIRTAF